jgi:hypothetical protein
MVHLVQSQLFLQHGITCHGFTTRQGGVSGGPLSSLNLSFHVGDDPSAVERNLERLRQHLGTSGPLLAARQVHGGAIIPAGELLARGFDGWTMAPTDEADAVIGRSGEGILAVATADCVPLLLADPKRGVCAAIHAGWRGLKANVVRAAVRATCAFGTTPGALLAVIGPRICEACYEVGTEVAACFPESSDPLEGKADKHSLDLGNAAEVSLIAAGVRTDRIDVLSACTSCEAQAFFSHRRDGGHTGRSLGFVGL